MSRSVTKVEKLLLYGKLQLKESWLGGYDKREVEQHILELYKEVNKLQEENQRLTEALEKVSGTRRLTRLC